MSTAQIIPLPLPRNYTQTPQGAPAIVPASFRLVRGGDVEVGDLVGEKPWEHELHDVYPITVWDEAASEQIGRPVACFLVVARAL